MACLEHSAMEVRMTSVEAMMHEACGRISSLEKLRWMVYGLGLAIAPTFAVLGFLWANRTAIASVAAIVGAPHP